MTAPPNPETVSEASRSRWGQTLGGAGEDQREALRELAASYWYCVYAWWRRAGLDAARAAAATLASFTRWLGEAPPSPSDSYAGRMREWLPARLAELEHRGVKLEGPAAIAIDPAWAEQRYADEPPGEPDAIFERRWAITVIEFTASTLRAEYSARGEETLFGELLAFAGFEHGDEERYTAAAARTGRTGGAMRKAVFDFRTRQRELLRGFVADTVLDPSDADSEITALLCACDAPGPNAASAPLPTAIQSLRPDEVLARAMRSVRMTHAGAGGWQPPTIDEAARLFPQYQVLSLLGRGGMGAVYKARQIALDRLVAIKLLPLEVSVDKDFAERFRREARAMAKLDHPNIIGVHDFGTTTEGHLYFAMTFVEGANLHQMIHGSGLSPAQALEIIGGVCDALAYAHGKGVVHRDIKPANVMVSVEGQVKVADFGLARLIDPAAEPLGQTSTNIVMGTPDYMAPEQMHGMNVDHRADIYSLGVMLYEMLCREVPRGIFDPPSARVAGVDARVDQVVTRAMQQQPERRYQSTQDMKTAVSAARTPLPAPPAPRVASAPLPKPPVMKAAPLPASRKSRKSKKSNTPLFIGIGAVIVLVAAAILWAKTRAGVGPVSSPAVAGAAIPARGDTRATPAADPITATKDAPFVNTLGMKFVPVPILGGPTGGQRVLFSVWDARVQDYEAFVKETKREWQKPAFEQGPTHPAVVVSWEDAQLFCQWLTAREHAAGLLPAEWRYRLPRDHEWSCAVGIGQQEDAAKLPSEKSGKIDDAFPWGAQWPPPEKAGNYASEELQPVLAAGKYGWVKGVMPGYHDGFAETSPVGIFAPNRFGLFDMGGNVQQWCEDWFDKEQKDRVLRGASWGYHDRGYLLSSNRLHFTPSTRGDGAGGFRCALAPASAPPPIAAVPIPALGGTTDTPQPAPSTPVPTPRASLPSTPSPSATPRPPTEVEKWFAQVDGPQQEAFQKQVLKPFESGVALLRARYLAALDTAIAKSSAAGRLAEALVWRTERQAFEKAQNVASDEAGTPAGVKALRADFRQELAGLDQNRSNRARTLLGQYDAMLAKNQTLLTQNQHLDDALLLKNKRDEIALAWLKPSPIIAVPVLGLQASKETPFVNSLGMRFVPVAITGGPSDGKRVLFCVWDTRVQDYTEYARATGITLERPPFEQGPAHPAVMVSWEDAQLFCQWLTGREQAAGRLPAGFSYRLPSDHEWSCAAGIGHLEKAAETPAAKDGKIKIYPWGTQWPPQKGAGNFYSSLQVDEFKNTSPVGSFPANQNGLYDMGGNVWQWCEDWNNGEQKYRVLRGASWNNLDPVYLLSAFRFNDRPTVRSGSFGFRCVLAESGG